jgi:hypothetical protein
MDTSIRRKSVSGVHRLTFIALAGMEAVTAHSFVLNDWVDKLILRINTGRESVSPGQPRKGPHRASGTIRATKFN